VLDVGRAIGLCFLVDSRGNNFPAIFVFGLANLQKTNNASKYLLAIIKNENNGQIQTACKICQWLLDTAYKKPTAEKVSANFAKILYLYCIML